MTNANDPFAEMDRMREEEKRKQRKFTQDVFNANLKGQKDLSQNRMDNLDEMRGGGGDD